MQRLCDVSDEMNEKLEGLGCVNCFQGGVLDTVGLDRVYSDLASLRRPADGECYKLT